MKKRAEITWSLMHPTPLSVDYMKKVVREIRDYRVDSFEICASCHSPLGGLDGLLLYDEYPAVAATLERDAILANRTKLREILAVAHAAGRPVYYWHREVVVPAELLKLIPELIDENGEFDLLGDAFSHLIAYKLEKALEAVPELDGVVLTLTEADFSAIHNSSPDRYVPELVVAHIVRIFARELAARGKRFILRSFGSIARDYQDILAGAKIVAKECSFEVETKITPYDFDPFLPENPFLNPLPGLTISAECDSLGEFLGAGYWPSENVANIVKYVRYAQKKGVDRFAIRLDRVCNNIFDAYPINLYAYQKAISDEHATADSIICEYAATHVAPEIRAEWITLGKTGIEVAKHLYYIDGNLIFHQFPLKADFKWLKAGGIFSAFTNHADLGQLDGIWSILSSQKTPGRAAILREKDDAFLLVQKSLARLEAIRLKLDSAEYARLSKLWNNVYAAAIAIRAFVRCIAAYFDDMEKRLDNPKTLLSAIENARNDIAPFLSTQEKTVENSVFVNGMDHSLFSNLTSDIGEAYMSPLLSMCKMLLGEYQLDLATRQNAPAGDDLIVAGSITDDYRCRRYMHASHAAVIDGKLVRLVANQVFPNGFIQYNFASPGLLTITGYGDGLQISVNSNSPQVHLFKENKITLNLATSSQVTLRKISATYPAVETISLKK